MGNLDPEAHAVGRTLVFADAPEWRETIAALFARDVPAPAEVTDACVRDTGVLALRSKIEVTRDSALSTIAAAVDITTADGKIHQLSQSAARGSDVNPMSDTDLEDKLRTTAHGWNPHYDTAPLIDAIWALDTSADVSSLARLAVPR